MSTRSVALELKIPVFALLENVEFEMVITPPVNKIPELLLSMRNEDESVTAPPVITSALVLELLKVQPLMIVCPLGMETMPIELKPPPMNVQPVKELLVEFNKIVPQPIPKIINESILHEVHQMYLLEMLHQWHSTILQRRLRCLQK